MMLKMQFGMLLGAQQLKYAWMNLSFSSQI